MHVADLFCYFEAAAEIKVSVIPELSVSADHAEVMVGDGAPAAVVNALESQKRLLVMRQRLGQCSLNVGDDTQVLFSAAAELRPSAIQLERTVKLLSGLGHRSTFEIEHRQGVERLGGECHVTQLHGGRVAPLAMLARECRFVAMVVHRAEPTKCFSQNCGLSVLFGGGDRCVIALNRLGDASQSLVLLSLSQKRRCAGRLSLLAPSRNGWYMVGLAHCLERHCIAGEVIDRSGDSPRAEEV
jgi:hypothetical protein